MSIAKIAADTGQSYYLLQFRAEVAAQSKQTAAISKEARMNKAEKCREIEALRVAKGYTKTAVASTKKPALVRIDHNVMTRIAKGGDGVKSAYIDAILKALRLAPESSLAKNIESAPIESKQQMKEQLSTTPATALSTPTKPRQATQPLPKETQITIAAGASVKLRICNHNKTINIELDAV